jgi:uncharacterized membrane protein
MLALPFSSFVYHSNIYRVLLCLGICFFNYKSVIAMPRKYPISNYTIWITCSFTEIFLLILLVFGCPTVTSSSVLSHEKLPTVS